MLHTLKVNGLCTSIQGILVWKAQNEAHYEAHYEAYKNVIAIRQENRSRCRKKFNCLKTLIANKHMVWY